jgi:L-malate glycosyltransferase
VSVPRVLQLVHADENGGVEMLAHLIGGDLRSAGADIDTLFLYPAFVSGTGAKLAGLGRALVRMTRSRPDVIIAYQPTASVMAGLVGWALGCPVRIVHQTTKPATIHPVSRALDRWLGCGAFYSLNIANSHATLAEFDSYPAAYRARLKLIPHGLNPPEPRAGRAETLRRYDVPGDGPILLSAGRLSGQKAQQHIIAALPHLPKARLVLAGGGPLEASYRELSRASGVASRVHFLGYLEREQVGDLMGAADVFVFPSTWETFGLAAVEAAMLGVPVVASNLPVLREVLTAEGRTAARFLDCSRSQALADAITAALEPMSLVEARDLAPLLRQKHSETMMLAAYRAMVWPAGQPAASAARADEMQQDGSRR